MHTAYNTASLDSVVSQSLHPFPSKDLLVFRFMPSTTLCYCRSEKVYRAGLAKLSIFNIYAYLVIGEDVKENSKEPRTPVPLESHKNQR